MLGNALNQENEFLGWKFDRSIAIELDIALSWVLNLSILGLPPDSFLKMLNTLPQEWIVEWRSVFGKTPRMLSVLEPLAFLTGTLEGEDYSAVTLPMRELSLKDFLEYLNTYAESCGIQPRRHLPPMQQAEELYVAVRLKYYRDWGFKITPTLSMPQYLRQDIQTALRFLNGEELHNWFWHWLDRFYFGYYQPWRIQREELMAEQERNAVLAMGINQSKGLPLVLDWLPPQNPLIANPEFMDAVQNKSLGVVFLADPFGLVDVWTLLSNRVLVTYSRTADILESYRSQAAALAERAFALADPTRLMILRLIRHMGASNTQIADFMGLSRPTVSVHAKILREAGLIRSYEQGRAVKHEIVAQELRRLFYDLEAILDLPLEDE